MVPCLALFDDQFLASCRVFGNTEVEASTAAHESSSASPKSAWRKLWRGLSKAARGVVCAALAMFIAYKSTDPVLELFSKYATPI